MRYAIVKNGAVAAVILWDGSTPLNVPGSLVRTDVANVGDAFDGSVFTPGATPVRKTLQITTRAAALKVLANRLGPDAVELMKVALGNQASATVDTMAGDDAS